MIRETRRTVPVQEVDPMERNKRSTLDQLWSDSAFKDHYEQQHRPLYDSLCAILECRRLLAGAAPDRCGLRTG